MKNLEKAKQLLLNNGFTCVICKGNKIYTSTERGVAPILNLIDNKADLNGFSVADKVIGKAAAMLFSLAGVKEIFTDVISVSARDYLISKGIEVSYNTLTDRIINRAGDGLCPMESLVMNIDDEAVAYRAIKEKLQALRKDKV